MSKENPKILKNAAYCKVCYHEIESKTRHDFKYCPCGNVAVDGGRAYIRRLFRDLDLIEERNIFDESQEPSKEDYRE